MTTVRIAHFIETDLPGGAEAVMMEICRAGVDHGFAPVVLHFGTKWIVDQCRDSGIPEHTLPFRRLFKSTATLPLFALQFGAYLKKLNVQLIHSHLFGPVTGAALAAALFRIPHVGTLHDVHMLEEKPARWVLIKLACLLGTGLVTVSEQMAEFYSANAHLAAGEMRVIYNGIRSPMPELNGPSELRGVLAPVPDCMLLTCVGRLVPLKRVDQVLSALDRTTTSRPMALVVVGDGPMRPVLEAQARSLGRHVVFVGQRSDVANILEASDAFVQFSESEGLSMSILEAMAAGLPCIVSDVGGNAELVEHERGGYMVPPESVAGLASAIDALASLPEPEMRQMGAFNRRKVHEHFDSATNYLKYFELYRSLMAR